MYRFYDYNDIPITIFNISDKQLALLGDIYKDVPIPHNSYYENKELYEFVDGNNIYDFLDYFMIPLDCLRFVEEEHVDEEGEVDVGTVSDDFVANWEDSASEATETDSDWSCDEGTWD